MSINSVLDDLQVFKGGQRRVRVHVTETARNNAIEAQQ